jgi:hypothetical protein
MKRQVLAVLLAATVAGATGCPGTETSREWRELRLPVTAARETSLTSVSCWSPDACAAVGSGDGKPLAIVGLGRDERVSVLTWPVATPPRPPADPGAEPVVDDRMASVSCTFRLCAAVGARTGLGVERELLWRGQDGDWRTDEGPPGTGLRLRSVSCVGTYCMALARGSAALRWDGSTWSLTPPWTGSFGGGERAACSAPDRCVALKQFWHSGVNADIHRWDGTAWREEWQAPGPLAGGWPADVACASDGVCAAVGKIDRSSSLTEPEAFALVSRDGRTWVEESPPAGLGALAAVSCTPGTCVAVPRSGGTGRIGVWAPAGGWRVAPATTEPAVSWESVSCARSGTDGPARCVVVGTRTPAGGPGRAVAFQFGV